ncbi:FAD-dependent oxidoreductase [Anaerobacillus alkaliphilus]|uniref:FAD-dependent oxidoreductase n=1 Tax=Anaerobacillus alkaliphilus TaxID=1548597 RepID=A0A4Q0VU24_9BACI|nr:FAD-dependent oxidoreductase [Anaerobacillus alkaliphilus]RXJ02177.1 FAD-dependent oxidoreductase [Anaerobacillus alkaliphilus]
MTKQINADVVVIGGGIGGCTAALAAAKLGNKVIMTEETKWIGGQLTSQAVPPDEHKWIEQFGCTSTYREFRNRVRDYYRTNYPLKEEAKANPLLNPGNGWVSRLAHEPKVALAILYDMLMPYLSNGKLTIMLETVPVAAQVEDDVVKQVTIERSNQERLVLTGKYFLDATECGDLLPLAGVEYVTGAEAKSVTGEYHAPKEANPQDMQSITHVFAVEYLEGEDHTIDKPEQYEFWKQYQAPFLGHQQLSWYAPDASTGRSKPFEMFHHEDLWGLWDYRRIIDRSIYEEGFYDGDISLINWPQNDYWLGSIIDVSAEERRKHLEGARELSLSVLYWLQTEAPRPDGGKGYPGLRLRPDILGTEDGLAMHPYIRESRRIKAEFTIVEEYINAEARGSDGIKEYEDSVGVGSYHIDLHPTTVTGQFFYTESYPFEIPLGSLIPIRVKNLLPACKNIGATHITNGCIRVHPVEWNIGESVGYLAGFAIRKNVSPRQVREDRLLLQEFQQLLVERGIELHWDASVNASLVAKG